MAEWSKAEHLSCSLFGDAGSNPARCTLLGYSFFIGTILFQEFTQQFNFLYEEDGDLHKLPCRILFRCWISQIIQHHFKNTDSNWTLSVFQPDCPGYDVRTVPMVFWLASMAEWSKAEHLSCSLFGDAGSNPARCTLLQYSFFTGTISFQECFQQLPLLLKEVRRTS